MKVLAMRLKSERENRKKHDSKWTQDYVADQIGVARPTYTGYERGTKTPPTKIVDKLAELFETQSDYLIGRSKEKSEALLNDPELELYIRQIQSSSEETRNEAKSFLQYLLQKEKGRNPGDKQNKE